MSDRTGDQLRVIGALYLRIWPEATTALVDRYEATCAVWLREEREAFVVWARGEPLAISMFSRREIWTTGGTLRVMALVGVCSAPEFRGQGLGAKVVRAAFAQVDDGTFAAALWQTAARP